MSEAAAGRRRTKEATKVGVGWSGWSAEVEGDEGGRPATVEVEGVAEEVRCGWRGEGARVQCFERGEMKKRTEDVGTCLCEEVVGKWVFNETSSKKQTGYRPLHLRMVCVEKTKKVMKYFFLKNKHHQSH
ncbi:hypothetical protein HanRHA438_Chr09g0422541 [Helianthus annuus]|nr:hypothetical protein HanRHA438_Chr09g0422541 [Helianthus annuus]